MPETPVHNQHEKYISIWEKAVDTQMHFNEMCVKSRQLGLTFVAATLGVAVVLLSRGDDFSLTISLVFFEVNIHISVILILSSMLALHAVRILDLNVYHKMLRGSVAFGEDFEEKYMKQIFSLNKGMTQAISHFSRFDDAEVTKSESGEYEYSGSSRFAAEDKIRNFYTRTMGFLGLAAAVLLIITNLSSWAGTDSSIDVGSSLPVENANGDTEGEINAPDGQPAGATHE